MSYVLQITNEAGDSCGYLSTARTAANAKAGFLTFDGRRAKRFASKDKAAMIAARYNAMNSHRGYTATVKKLTEEIENAR